MHLVTPRSEVVTDGDLTWLQAVESSTRVRHTLGTFGLAVLILAGGATFTLLPWPLSVAATGVVVVTGMALFASIVRGAGSRLAVSDLGVYVQNGGRAYQVGWAAVRGVHARPAGSRVRLVVDDGYRPRTTRAPFEAAAARRWLEIAGTEATRRQLHPQTDPDGFGFTTSP